MDGRSSLPVATSHSRRVLSYPPDAKVLPSGEKVTEVTLDLLRVRVAFRVWGRLCIEVDATFHSPEPRTIVMTIVDGEGAGSVVETHSTPAAHGRSFVTEAALATSDRPGFLYAMKAARFIRPLMARAAHKLWIEDVAYAERAYALQQGRIITS